MLLYFSQDFWCHLVLYCLYFLFIYIIILSWELLNSTQTNQVQLEYTKK